VREIKFKAWNKETKQIDDVIMLGKEFCSLRNTGSWDKDKLEFLQYTGLKDKNGKEIYEGDIVREDNWFTALFNGLHVVFNQELLQFGAKEPDDYFTALTDIKGEWEIIGNIYENPELLGEK